MNYNHNIINQEEYIMTFHIQLDISHETPSEMVQQFAIDHGCTATLIEEFGPAGGNPLYQFSSDKFDYLQELTEQVFGIGFFDEEAVKTMIWEE
jgi:hypothetical protein